MSAGAQLTSIATGGQIIRPGAALARAAQPLASKERALGKYPEQWLYPGPDSRMVMANGAIPVPAIVDPEVTATGTILTYEVPEGYRLVLSGITMGAFAADWNRGSGQLLFTLVVIFSTGPRNVEFLQNLPFGVGSEERPRPLQGRLEFAPLDVLQVQVKNVGLPTPGADDYAYALLDGFTYPTTQSA